MPCTGVVRICHQPLSPQMARLQRIGEVVPWRSAAPSTSERRHVREVDDPQLIGATPTSACSNTLRNQPAESRSKASFNFLSNELSNRLPQCHIRINSAQSLLYERAFIASRLTASTRNASTTTCNAEALCATRRSSTLVVA